MEHTAANGFDILILFMVYRESECEVAYISDPRAFASSASGLFASTGCPWTIHYSHKSHYEYGRATGISD